MKKITRKTLKKWGACENGYKYFIKTFPKGADLKTASEKLIEEEHISWSEWLWEKCSRDNEYINQTIIAVGDYGTAIAGDFGTARAGDRGTARAGDRGTAKAGDYGTAKAGYFGTARAGDRGTARAGDRGTAKAGDYGTAKAGDYGTAVAGYFGTAVAGYFGTAKAGDYGTASAGKGGVISIDYYTDKKLTKKVGVIDGVNLLPNTLYQVVKGEFKQVVEE